MELLHSIWNGFAPLPPYARILFEQHLFRAGSSLRVYVNFEESFINSLPERERGKDLGDPRVLQVALVLSTSKANFSLQE